MESKPAPIIDNGMAGVGAALEADDHVGGLRQHIRDLALAFVAPVGAYDCFLPYVLPSGNRDSQPLRRICLIRFPTQHVYYNAFFRLAQGLTTEKNKESVSDGGGSLCRGRAERVHA